MDHTMVYIGYLHYLVVLFLVTGALLLRVDMRMYQLMKLPKEQKVTRWLGWINLTFGLVIWIGKWLLGRWVF